MAMIDTSETCMPPTPIQMEKHQHNRNNSKQEKSHRVGVRVMYVVLCDLLSSSIF